MVRIGSYNFPPASTTVEVKTAEYEGRLRKRVDVRALYEGFLSVDALIAELEMLDAQTHALHEGQATLSLHAGRYYDACHVATERYLDQRAKLAAVHMELHTDDIYERSIVEHVALRSIVTPGQTVTLTNAGNAPAPPRLELSALADIDGPTIGDGERTFQFNDTLSVGETLVIDAETLTATRGEANALPLVEGDFVMLSPGETTLTFDKLSGETCLLSVRIVYRDRWL